MLWQILKRFTLSQKSANRIAPFQGKLFVFELQCYPAKV